MALALPALVVLLTGDPACLHGRRSSGRGLRANLRGLLALAAAAGMLALVAGPAQGETQCQRVRLSRQLTLPSGLQVLPSGDFLVASPRAGTLTRFGADGAEKWTRRGGHEPPNDFDTPAVVTRSPSSDLLLIAEKLSVFYLADLEGTILGKYSTENQSARRPRLEFAAPVLLGGNRVGGLATFRPLDGGPVTAGLVAAALEGDGWQGPWTTVDVRDRSFVAYTLDPRMVTATRDGLVLLATGDTHELRWVAGEALRTIPLRIGELDAFPKNLRPGPSAMGPVYQALRALRLPVGVYWDRSDLFVLVASPAPGGSGRQWELVAVDPASGRAKRRLTLPTAADELGISPGANHWIVLEKQILGVEGDPRAQSALRIPSAWFHATVSPLSEAPSVALARCGS